MSLSSNTAQTRELTELRNHLKWLDEERRKSSRKMAELEQRLAQQGRDLADRDQKIQELEWHVANFSERFERIPDLDSNVAGTEQRLQDLEWHLSNMNTQLTRLPNPEEERARLKEEIARAIKEAQERVETEHSLLESRLRSEMTTLRESTDHRVLSIRQEEQAQAISEMDQQFAALQESVGILTAQLRERTSTLAAESQASISTLAAESQANISTLAAGLQEHLDAMSAENQSRMDFFAVQWQAKLDELSAAPSDEPSPELLRLEEQFAAVNELQQEWQTRWMQLELQVAQLGQEIEPAGVRQQEVDQLTTRFGQQFESLNANYQEVEQQLAQLRQQFEPLDVHNVEVEQQLAQLRQQFEPLDVRNVEVEQQLAQLKEQLAQIEIRFSPLSDWQVEMEENLAKLGHIREIMPLLDRLEQELELRQAEEVRLANLIGTQENRFAPLAASLEEITESNNSLLARANESERSLEELRASVQDFNDNWKPAVSELNRRITPISERLTVLSNTVMKAEAGIQTLMGDQAELRETAVSLTDDLRRSQSDIAGQLDSWQATLDENKDTIERFTQQWITLSNQYKEARMAVQNFAHWQKQLEQQKREASEMLRVESNRMQARWDGFMVEIQDKLKNFELDLNQKWQTFEIENEQKWSAARRNEQLRHEEIAAVDELIQKLQQDNRNLIWRVQAAQADAIKKWPRLLMEEVEKAVEINPNRRLTTATTPRADMSVVDAIEQGLITIDYTDESPID